MYHRTSPGSFFSSCVLVILFALSGTFTLSAQTTDHAAEPIDNPQARVTFERMRRADPATGSIPADVRAKELSFAVELAASLFGDGKGRTASSASGILWREIGPGNQGGRTRALAIDASNDSVILAGGVSGGLWRSTDEGATWSKITGIDQLQSITAIAQDIRSGAQSVWYYGTGETRANSASLPGDGLFKSVDGGRSFSRLTSTVTNRPQSRDQLFDNVHRIVCDHTNRSGDVVLVAGYGGIARSTDGGESWDEVLGGYDNRAVYTDIAISATGVFYATLASSGRNVEGVFRSVDGVRWDDITPDDFPSNFHRIIPAIAPSNEEIVYFFANTPNIGPNGHSLWAYDHNGGRPIWEDRTEGLLPITETYTNYCGSLAVDPEDPDLVYLGGVSFTRTTDGFRDTANSERMMGNGQHADQHSIAIFPNDPSRLLAGHDGGVSLTNNARADRIRWQSRNRGYATTQFYTVAIDPTTEGSGVVIGGTQDNGTWWLDGNDGFTDGLRVFGADGSYCAISDAGADFYTSYQNGVVFRSQFDSVGRRQTWGRIDPEGADDYFFINPFTLDRADRRVMYLPEGRNLWRNSDLTETTLDRRNEKSEVNWEEMEAARLGPNSGKIFSVATSQSNPPHRLYYGTTIGGLFRVDEANTGDPAAVSVGAEEFPRGLISCIAVDPYDGDRLFAVFSSYNVQSIFLSDDGGSTWQAVTGNLEQNANGTGNGPSVTWVEMLRVNNSWIYFAATSTGLYSTRLLDGMDTRWEPEGVNVIGNVVVDMIAVRPVDGQVAIGSHGRGLFVANAAEALVSATITVRPGSITFDTVLVNESRRESFTVANDARSQRPIAGRIELAEGEDFGIVSGDGPFSLAPGEEIDVVVECRPTKTGLLSGRATIVHDASNPTGDKAVFLTARGRSLTGVRAESGRIVSMEIGPNPVASSATLRIAVEKADRYLLQIHDESGRLVGTIHDGHLEAGQHEIRFDCSSLFTGAYVLSLVDAERVGLRETPFVVQH